MRPPGHSRINGAKYGVKQLQGKPGSNHKQSRHTRELQVESERKEQPDSTPGEKTQIAEVRIEALFGIFASQLEQD